MASKAVRVPYSVGASTSVQILQPSRFRRAVIIGQPTTGRITVGPNQDVTDYAGIVINTGDLPFKLETCDYGCLVQGPLYAISNSGTVTGAVISIEGDPDQ